MAEAGRRPRPGNSGTSPGPCIRMDTAAPSRQQLERNQYAASPQGGEPQRPGKWGFGGFQPLQAQKSRWKVTGTVPAGVPSDTQHPPPRGLGGDLGGRCPPTASLAPSSEVGNELSCFLPSLFSGLLREVTAHFACHGVCACHSPGSQLAVIGAGPAGMVFVWLVCCSCENWSPHL